MHLYEEFAFCFVCKIKVPLSEVVDVETIRKIKKAPEDIKEAVEYITSLLPHSVRGLSLPQDDTGYYILWPDKSYYKKRLFRGDLRYMGPRGHRAPLLSFPGSEVFNLVLVEGELNALSLRYAVGDDHRYTIASPGSCGEFLRHLDKYLTYTNITVIVDLDPPGVVYGLELKKELLKHGKRVQLVAAEKDYNQILTEEGKEALKKIAEEMGL